MDLMNIIMARLQQLPNLLIEFAPGIALAVVIFLIGRWVVRKLSNATVKASNRMPNIDETLARFFGSIVLFLGMCAVIISSLSAMNINLGFVATIVASLALAIGFALQDTLGDVASGLMLVAFRPYEVGQEVELNGQKGVVSMVGLFATRMITRDNIEVVISNSDALGNPIHNFYAFGTRRLEMDVGIGYGSDIQTAIDCLLNVANADARVLDEPAPWAKVTGLGDSAVNLQLRLWCAADDYRKIQMDLSEPIKLAFDKAGVEIPYAHEVAVRKKEPADV